MAVPQEIELKLETSPDAVATLLSHPVLEKGRRREAQALRSLYYDTPDRALRQAGVSLRIRSGGAAAIQTVKATQGAGAIVLDRLEWEQSLPCEELDLAALAATGLPVFTDRKEPLAVVFAIAVDRTVVRVPYARSEIEVALDQGRIECDERTEPFTELELELVDGERADLLALALELSQATPLHLSFTTKSDRGYECASTAPRRVKGEPAPLDRAMTGAQAFRRIAASCLRHLTANEAVLRRHRDPEAVHQARVALRRLRAAVTLFKSVVADAEMEAVRSELKWMADQLGEARDLEVFITQTLHPARNRAPDAENIAGIIAEYEARRDRAYGAAEAALGSIRFARGVLRTAAWVEAGAWLTQPPRGADAARDRPVTALAEHELSRRWRKIRKDGKHLSDLDPEERHRLRIAIKKLRYATEFFQTLFEEHKKRKRAALSCVEAMQEILGELNDIAVADSMGGSPVTEALRSDQEERADDLLRKARKQYRRFASLKPFWDGSP